ncbi:IS3 family transposase, partial [Desulfonatronum thiodismutans]|uniref:IS3 family transposase n=1 Tax=Desulfonatronum thiodismutans TaxID=159290 RepID=UPI0004DB6EFC
LSADERATVLEILHSQRFQDSTPHEIYASLLDEGRMLCSISTMYRLLRQEGENQGRRRQTARTHYEKPELLATAPNQVWSWDITKLKGPRKWNYFYLYVIMDIYSRYVTGWMIASRESQSLAKRLIEESCEKQNIAQGQLTIHADRGPSMRSKTVAQLLADLGITKTHSRPYTSNDNPFSESQFKTLKYHPCFPGNFGSQEDALAYGRTFFPWYNEEHRHSGIGFMTPEQVHYGIVPQILETRSNAMTQAFLANPIRWNGRHPELPKILRPQEAVWINPPTMMKTLH